MLDPLGESIFAAVLGAQQLHARITDNITYCGRWFDSDPTGERGLFHLIDEGGCWVESAALPEPVALAAGDLIMFPHGHAHTLCNALTRPLPEGAAGGDTVMLCGEFTFATARSNLILEALPDWFVVREREAGVPFRSLAKLLAAESGKTGFASNVVLDKLADAFFVMAVRSHIERAENRRGLLAAIFDPRMARALSAMHREPGRDWTVATLAEVALQSRTAFAQAFSDLLGVSPIEYLTHWRMNEAARILRDPRQSVAAAAERLGYQTEAAFRRAFKKHHGFGPGEVRRAARTVPAPA